MVPHCETFLGVTDRAIECYSVTDGGAELVAEPEKKLVRSLMNSAT
jgi:hypothetical protein